MESKCTHTQSDIHTRAHMIDPARNGKSVFFVVGVFFATGARRFFFFWLRVRGTFFLAAGARRVFFLLRVRGMLFFCCTCVRRGLPSVVFCCGHARGVFFFAAGARRVSVCCGCAARFFLLRVRGAFFLLRVRGALFSVLLARGTFSCCGYAARFFCFGCAVRFSFCCRCTACFCLLRMCGKSGALFLLEGKGQSISRALTMNRSKTAAWLGWGRIGLAWPQRGWGIREIQLGGLGDI